MTGSVDRMYGGTIEGSEKARRNERDHAREVACFWAEKVTEASEIGKSSESGQSSGRGCDVFWSWASSAFRRAREG